MLGYNRIERAIARAIFGGRFRNTALSVVTQKQIAKRLGVSRQLVGFALGGGGTIAEKTRQEILAAAAEMGYHRNEIARAMVTGRNPVLGFLGEEPETENVARMLAGALDGADEGDYTLKLLRLDLDYTEIEETLRRCLELRLAGIITVNIREEAFERLRQELARRQIPLAVLEGNPPHPGEIRVISDDVQGCRAAVSHLYELGHRRIGIVSALHGPWVVDVRESAFQQAIQDVGLTLPPDWLVYGDWGRYPMTADAANALLDSPSGPPTAICCIDDKTALTVLRILRKRGLNVPRDISVVGYADLNFAEFADPPLTTVAQQFGEMGHTAVRLLLERLHRRETTDAETDNAAMDAAIPTRLIIRESTAPPPSHPIRPTPL